MLPPLFLSTRSSQLVEPIEEPALVFPSTDTAPGRDFGGIGFAGDTSSALKTGSRTAQVSVLEDTGIIEDPGFEFDPEGNMVVLPSTAEGEGVIPPTAGPASRLGSDSAISARVRQEHEAGLQGAQVRTRILPCFTRVDIRS